MWRIIGRVVAVLGVLLLAIIAYDVALSVIQLRRERGAQKLIAPREVQLDGLRLEGSRRDAFELSGVIRNLSPSYVLKDARVTLVVEDCVKGDCREQARGHAEVIRRVPPNEAAVFATRSVSLPDLPPPA